MKILISLCFVIGAVFAQPIPPPGTPTGPTLPATCSPSVRGQNLFIKTGANAGLYYCSAANTWTAVGGGGGLTIGTTAISGGTTTRLLYDISGKVGEPISVQVSNGGGATESVTVYNPTASTGKTNLGIRQGAGTTNGDTSFGVYGFTNDAYGTFPHYVISVGRKDNATELFLGGMIVRGSSASASDCCGERYMLNGPNSYFSFGSTFALRWAPTTSTDTGDGEDVSFSRVSAGVLGIGSALSAGSIDGSLSLLNIVAGGNISAVGSISSGTGSAVGGAFDLKQGTLPSIVSTTMSFVAPVSITGYEVVVPGAAATGIPKWTNSSNVVTESIITGGVTASGTSCAITAITSGIITGGSCTP